MAEVGSDPDGSTRAFYQTLKDEITPELHLYTQSSRKLKRKEHVQVWFYEISNTLYQSQTKIFQGKNQDYLEIIHTRMAKILNDNCWQMTLLVGL